MDKATLIPVQGEQYATGDDFDHTFMIRTASNLVPLVLRIFGGRDDVMMKIGHGHANDIGPIISIAIEKTVWLMTYPIADLLVKSLREASVIAVNYQPAALLANGLEGTLRQARQETVQ